MIDFRTVRNEEIIRVVRRKLYGIVYEHVKQYNDENVMKHIEMFMAGVFWATGLRYAVGGDGEVYICLKGLSWAEIRLFDVWYKVIDVNLETKILRNSINRHYHKMGYPSVKEVGFYGWD